MGSETQEKNELDPDILRMADIVVADASASVWYEEKSIRR
jgi:ornithine cyclodeaminase/alanine dehydrogenase-like protein (mu-crystallin family)